MEMQPGFLGIYVYLKLTKYYGTATSDTRPLTSKTTMGEWKMLIRPIWVWWYDGVQVYPLGPLNFNRSVGSDTTPYIVKKVTKKANTS